MVRRVVALLAGAAMVGGAAWLVASRDTADEVAVGGPPAVPSTSEAGREAEPCLVPPSPPTLAPYRFAPHHTGPVPAGLPRFVVAIRENGQVILLRADDGVVIRVLADPVVVSTGQLDCSTAESALTLPSPVYEPARDLAVVPDGTEVYFVRDRSVERVAIGGGAVEQVVAPASVPSFSWDGRRFAFGRPGRESICYADEVVVRDLATGGERYWRVHDDPDDPLDHDCIWALSLSPDGRRLAYTLGWEDLGETYLVDVDEAGELGEAHHRLVAPGNRLWTEARFLPSGQLVVEEFGPAPPDWEFDSDRVSRGFVVVDPSTRLAVGELPVPAGSRDFDVDPTGRHVLVVTEGGRLLRRSGGVVATIGEGLWSARWVP